MGYGRVLFAQSGVQTFFWLPPLVAFAISLFTSTAGVSGAFLLLPFQVTVLGFSSPAVSPTNLVFNIVAIPSGVWRYVREGRMVWPLTWVVIAGTLPGVVLGGLVRLHWLLDPRPFKAFVGCVLLYLAVRLLLDIRGSRPSDAPAPEAPASGFAVTLLEFSWRRLRYRFQGSEHGCAVPGLFALSLVVGVIGGAYGIGGGAIIAPFFVAIYHLPVHTVAGAALMGTFVTSVVGVLFYQLVAPCYAGLTVAPDWLLGALFGLGGIGGMYLGARNQRRLPAVAIKAILVVVLGTVAARYAIDFIYH